MSCPERRGSTDSLIWKNMRHTRRRTGLRGEMERVRRHASPGHEARQGGHKVEQ